MLTSHAMSRYECDNSSSEKFGELLESMLKLIPFHESPQGALMRHYTVISELLEYMETLGWEPYQADHEVNYASLPHFPD